MLGRKVSYKNSLYDIEVWLLWIYIHYTTLICQVVQIYHNNPSMWLNIL